jgi:hypothetical protein
MSGPGSTRIWIEAIPSCKGASSLFTRQTQGLPLLGVSKAACKHNPSQSMIRDGQLDSRTKGTLARPGLELTEIGGNRRLMTRCFSLSTAS